MRARKRLGQNFLVDAGVRDRIVSESGVNEHDEVLEIGAGVGTLSVGLARACRRLLAVELDPRLVPLLRRVTGGFGNVSVIEEDILKTDVRALFPAGGQLVVGNIPYYLTGALLPKLLDTAPRPRRLALVVQKEVAERWTASGSWSLATVAVHVYSQPELAFTIPRSAFTPAPRVDSALVTLAVRDRPAVSAGDAPDFFRLVGKVFQFRRKQLRVSLARVAGLATDAAAARLSAAGIDPARRPETLTVAEWLAVHRGFRD